MKMQKFLLYDTPRTSLCDDEVSFWLFDKDDTIESVSSEFCKKYLHYKLPF